MLRGTLRPGVERHRTSRGVRLDRQRGPEPGRQGGPLFLPAGRGMYVKIKNEIT